MSPPLRSPSLRYPLALPLRLRRGGAARPPRDGTGVTVATLSITATDPCRLSDGPREGVWGFTLAEIVTGTERPAPGVALCARRKGGGGVGETAGVRRGGVSKEWVAWCDEDESGGSKSAGSKSVIAENREGGVDCEIPGTRPGRAFGREGGGN